MAAWDLTGVQQILACIAPLAQRFSSWAPFLHLGEGHYHRLLGELPAAEQAYRRAFELAAPSPDYPLRLLTPWPITVAALTETLVSLDRAGEAQALAAATLRECERREIREAGIEGRPLFEARRCQPDRCAVYNLSPRCRPRWALALGLPQATQARELLAWISTDRN